MPAGDLKQIQLDSCTNETPKEWIMPTVSNPSIQTSNQPTNQPTWQADTEKQQRISHKWLHDHLTFPQRKEFKIAIRISDSNKERQEHAQSEW